MTDLVRTRKGNFIMKAYHSVSLLVLSLAISTPAFAGDFTVDEHSAADMGRANAGQATHTSDASVAHSNPALMTQFDQPTITTNIAGVFPSSRFTDSGSVDLLGAPLGGNTKGFVKNAVVPSLYAVYPINDRLAAGLAITSQYGTDVTYAKNWPGRYQALESNLLTLSVNPSIAFEITDGLSVSGGLVLDYAHSKQTGAIDFGAVCLAEVGPATCGPAGLLPQMADGSVAVTGNGWRVGYDLGLAWTPVQQVTLGAHYRSEIDHRVTGTARYTIPTPAAFLNATGAFSDGPASAQVILPASLDMGLKVEASPKLTLYGNATWTNWSTVKQLQVNFANPAQAPSTIPLNYKDSWRLAVGADYAVSSAWTLRAGYARDNTPSNPAFLTARLPDSNRNIYALGASYMGMPGWQVDLAYNRVDPKSVTLDQTGPFGDQLKGRINSHADIVSLGVTKRF